MLIYNLTKDIKITITEKRIIKKYIFYNALKNNLFYVYEFPKNEISVYVFNILKLTIKIILLEMHLIIFF